jgi:hypothetical protein
MIRTAGLKPKSMHASARPIEDVHATSSRHLEATLTNMRYFPFAALVVTAFGSDAGAFFRLQLLSYCYICALILLYVCCDSLQLGCLRCFTTLRLRRSRATGRTPFARATSALTVLRWHRESRTTGGAQRHTRTHAQTHTLRPRTLVS